MSENKIFKPGSFIIPFTGNSTDDKKIIAIMYDYNQSCEIEICDEINIPIFIITEQINTQAFPLNDVNVAQLYSRISSGGFIFLELLAKCGFLNDWTYGEHNVLHFTIELGHPDKTPMLEECETHLLVNLYLAKKAMILD